MCVCAPACNKVGWVSNFCHKYFVCKFLQCCVCVVSSRLHVDRGSKFIYGSVLCLKLGTYLPFTTTAAAAADYYYYYYY